MVKPPIDKIIADLSHKPLLQVLASQTLFGRLVGVLGHWKKAGRISPKQRLMLEDIWTNIYGEFLLDNNLALCEVCHDPFEQRRPDHKTCSPKCRTRLYYIRLQEGIEEFVSGHYLCSEKEIVNAKFGDAAVVNRIIRKSEVIQQNEHGQMWVD